MMEPQTEGQKMGVRRQAVTVRTASTLCPGAKVTMSRSGSEALASWKHTRLALPLC